MRHKKFGFYRCISHPLILPIVRKEKWCTNTYSKCCSGIFSARVHLEIRPGNNIFGVTQELQEQGGVRLRKFEKENQRPEKSEKIYQRHEKKYEKTEQKHEKEEQKYEKEQQKYEKEEQKYEV